MRIIEIKTCCSYSLVKISRYQYRLPFSKSERKMVSSIIRFFIDFMTTLRHMMHSYLSIGFGLLTVLVSFFNVSETEICTIYCYVCSLYMAPFYTIQQSCNYQKQRRTFSFQKRNSFHFNPILRFEYWYIQRMPDHHHFLIGESAIIRMRTLASVSPADIRAIDLFLFHVFQGFCTVIWTKFVYLTIHVSDLIR